MISQERELADKRLADDRRRLVSDIRHELLSRLERIKLEALSARANAAASQSRLDGQSRDIVLVTPIENGRLVLPWDRSTGADAFTAALDETPFADAIHEGERDELVGKQFDLAVRAYRRALAAARLPAQTAFARLFVARALAKSGRNQDAAAEYRKVLLVPPGTADEQGVPLALYAARRLLDGPDVPGSDSRAIATILQTGLTANPSAPPAALYMIGDLADRLAGSGDQAVRHAAADLRRMVTDRSRDIEQAQALQNAFPTLIPASATSTTAAEPLWAPFGSQNDLWLVGVASLSDQMPLAIVVRATSMVSSLDAVRLARSNRRSGAPVFAPSEIASRVGGADHEPLGASFPGLSVVFAIKDSTEFSREWNLQRSFYFAVLVLVLSIVLVGGYLFWRDVRREVRLAEMRSQFVSSVSHELKTPLTAIRMFAETLLMGRSADVETRDEYLETIVNESERLTRLLNNVLDFSKIEQGKKTYRLEPYSLAAIVRAAAKAMTYPLSQQGFELRVEVDERLPHIAADPDAIEQAILNLLSNALKYSGQGRIIDLKLERDGGDAVISVTDRGLGIPEHEKTKIFEKFYRVSSAENRHIPGTGLGLTLVDHVARAHAGKVTVRSAPGEGSTFSIVLPLPDVGQPERQDVEASLALKTENG